MLLFCMIVTINLSLVVVNAVDKPTNIANGATFVDDVYVGAYSPGTLFKVIKAVLAADPMAEANVYYFKNAGNARGLYNLSQFFSISGLNNNEVLGVAQNVTDPTAVLQSLRTNFVDPKVKRIWDASNEKLFYYKDAPPVFVTGDATMLTSATGTTTVTLDPEIADLAEGNIRVKVGETNLDVGAYRIGNLSDGGFDVTFEASANITDTSEITIGIWKTGYVVEPIPVEVSFGDGDPYDEPYGLEVIFETNPDGFIATVSVDGQSDLEGTLGVLTIGNKWKPITIIDNAGAITSELLGIELSDFNPDACKLIWVPSNSELFEEVSRDLFTEGPGEKDGSYNPAGLPGAKKRVNIWLGKGITVR